MRLTREILHSAAPGGFNHEQIRLLGVPIPEKKGWLLTLVGKEISDDTWAKVVRLNGVGKKELRNSRKAIDTLPGFEWRKS